MGNTLSLIKAYGYKVEFPDEENDDDMDGDSILDRVTGMEDSTNYQKQSKARDSLGVRFELYSWGDEMPRMLAVTASVTTVYDDGIMPVGTFEIGSDWCAKLDRVVERANLEVTGNSCWYLLARYR